MPEPRCSRPGGSAYHTLPAPSASSAFCMNWVHIGAAMKYLSEFFVIFRRQLGLPPHTAVARFGVKPTVHASAKESDVPVLTATVRPRRVSSELRPKIIARLLSLDMIVCMM